MNLWSSMQHFKLSSARSRAVVRQSDVATHDIDVKCRCSKTCLVPQWRITASLHRSHWYQTNVRCPDQKLCQSMQSMPRAYTPSLVRIYHSCSPKSEVILRIVELCSWKYCRWLSGIIAYHAADQGKESIYFLLNVYYAGKLKLMLQIC